MDTWVEVLIMSGAGALAGAAAAAVMGEPVKARAAGSAITFGMMTLAWRFGTEVENKVLVNQGHPPLEPRRI